MSTCLYSHLPKWRKRKICMKIGIERIYSKCSLFKQKDLNQYLYEKCFLSSASQKHQVLFIVSTLALGDCELTKVVYYSSRCYRLQTYPVCFFPLCLTRDSSLLEYTALRVFVFSSQYELIQRMKNIYLWQHVGINIVALIHSHSSTDILL